LVAAVDWCAGDDCERVARADSIGAGFDQFVGERSRVDSAAGLDQDLETSFRHLDRTPGAWYR
jgi:hypothetical protein